MLINRFCSASKGSLLWITYFLRPCGLGGNQELVFRLWFDIIPSLSPIWNGTTTLPPVSPVSHWSSLGWGGGDAVLAPGLTISACPPGPGSPHPTESPFPSSGWESVFELNAVATSNGSTLFLHGQKFSAGVQKECLSFNRFFWHLTQGSVDSTWTRDSRDLL